jgi:hypothetical protein
MTTATLKISLDSGTLQSGGVVATLGQTCQLSRVATDGVRRCRYEIYAWPVGFTCPSGWTDGGDRFYFESTTTNPPSFVVTPWGKWMLCLRYNGAPDTDTTGLVDFATAISIYSPITLHDLADKETTQFGGYPRELQHDLRVIEAAIGEAEFESESYIHPACEVVSFALVDTAAPGDRIMGIAMEVDDRVFLASQSGTPLDGIWLWKGAAIPMVRPTDWTGTVDAGMTHLFPCKRIGKASTENPFGNRDYSSGCQMVLKSPTSGNITVGSTSVTFDLQGPAWPYFQELHPPVDVAVFTEVNVEEPGTDVFDGETIGVGRRILLLAQTNGRENGPYTFAGTSSSLQRDGDFTGYQEIVANMRHYFPVEGGASRGSGLMVACYGVGTVWSFGMDTGTAFSWLTFGMAGKPLSSVRWADVNTTTPLALQNGSEEFPFASVTSAISSLPEAGGVVWMCPGGYREDIVVDPSKTHVQLRSAERYPAYDSEGGTWTSGVKLGVVDGMSIVGSVSVTASDVADINPVLEIVDCKISGLLTLTASEEGLAPTLYLENCYVNQPITAASPLGEANERIVCRRTRLNALSGTITFVGDYPGIVLLDDYSYSSFVAVAATIINGKGFTEGEVTKLITHDVIGSVATGTTACLQVLEPQIIDGGPATVTLATPGTSDISIAVVRTGSGFVDYAVTNFARVSSTINDSVTLLLHATSGYSLEFV